MQEEDKKSTGKKSDAYRVGWWSHFRNTLKNFR